MTAPYFKDPYIEDRFNDQGYISIPNFLNENEVREMRSLYSSIHEEKHSMHSGVWTSWHDSNYNRAKEVSQSIRSLLTPKLDTIFYDAEAPHAAFLSKYAGENTFCELHRDFSVLNEEEFEYRNLWIPLIDINEQNGALFILPHSHKILGEELPIKQPWAYIEHIPTLMKYVKTFYPKAGDLLVYKDKTAHGSFKNLTNDTRPVLLFAVIPKGIQTFFYYLNGNEVEVYEVSPDYFLRHDLSQPPLDRKPIRTYPYNNKKYNIAELEIFFQSNF